MILLLIALGSCEKASIPPPRISWETYLGKWENINAFASSIDRIIITRKEAGRLSVQLLGSCGAEECEWGLFSYDRTELHDPVLLLPVFRDQQESLLQLRETESGKLELAALEGNPTAFETQYFTSAQSASFYQQLTFADARSVQLADTRINGGPEHPDNQLTSGSILIFQTNESRLGKIQVRGNDFYLSLRWQSWSADGEVDRSFDYYPFYKSGYYDLDDGKLDETPDHRYSEFYWSLESKVIRWLEPVNGTTFALYHLE